MNISGAFQDISEGIKNYEFWTAFGMNDLRAKYRRSKLGQWWITLSVALFIFVIGGLYRGIFAADSGTYMAYLAIGYITWLFLSDSINSGSTTLIKARAFILQKHWASSTFVFQLLYREVLFTLHHVVLLIPIFIYLKLWPGINGIFFGLIGFLFCIFTAFWVVILVALISLRYRDFPPIAQSLVRMAFFATPIIWIDRDLGAFGEWVTLLNPFGYFLTIVREPLLTGQLPTFSWIVAIGISLLTMVVSILALSVTRDKVPYWL